MTVDQADRLRDIAGYIDSFEGYENSKITSARQYDGDQDGDLIVGIDGEVGDTPVRIKQDGKMFDVFKREVTMTEVLKQIRHGIEAPE